MTTPKKVKLKPSPKTERVIAQGRRLAQSVGQNCILCRQHWTGHGPGEGGHRFIPDNVVLLDIFTDSTHELEPGDIVVEIHPKLIRVYRGTNA